MTETPAAPAPAPAAAPAAPSAGGNFLSNLFKPVTDKADAVFDKGKNYALSFTTARPGAASEQQLGDSIVYSMTDVYNGTIGNVLKTGSTEFDKLEKTGGATVMAVANPLARLATLHPWLAMKEGFKAPIIATNEIVDAAASTIGNFIKGTRQAIEGCIRRPLDRTATQLGRIPLLGRIVRPVLNLSNRLFFLPLDIIEATRAKIGAIDDRFQNWIRAKVPVGGGGGGTPAAAPVAAH